MSTPRIITVIVLVIFGIVLFFHSRPSSGNKQIIPQAFRKNSNINVQRDSVKKMFEDRGYAPVFQAKVQKYVDDKIAIDNKIIKLADQNKRLRVLEVEMKNKLVQLKTDADLKNAIGSQLISNNNLSNEQLKQLENSEKDIQIQIDETSKVLEQVTSTIKNVDANLATAQLINNKEYVEKSQIISDEITEKRNQLYLKIQEAKRLAEQAKKDKEERAAAFRAKMTKYKDEKVVIEPTAEEKYARALEIALKKKAIRLQAEAEMKQVLDAQRKLNEELSESERLAMENAANDRQAVLDENNRLIEEAQSEVENAEAKRLEAQAKIDEELETFISDAEKLKEADDERLADIEEKNREKLLEYQDEFEEAEKEQTAWDDTMSDMLQNAVNLEDTIVSENDVLQAEYQADLKRDEDGSYASEVTTSALLTEANWLVTQTEEIVQAKADMDVGKGGNSNLPSNSLNTAMQVARNLQDQQDLSIGKSHLMMFNLGYPVSSMSSKQEYDIKKNTFITSKLPTLAYINPVNGFDTMSEITSEITGPRERGRWLISGKVVPSTEEKLQNDMYAALDFCSPSTSLNNCKPAKDVMAKIEALGNERDAQIRAAADTGQLLEEDPLKNAGSHGFNDFGYVRHKPITSDFQTLIDECKFRCNKFSNCGGFALDENMQFCRLVNKDTLNLTERKMGGEYGETVIEPTTDTTGTNSRLYHMYYKVPETETEKKERIARVSRRARIIQLLPEYAKIPDPDKITGEDRAPQDITLRREAQFAKLLSDEELFKHCVKMVKTGGRPPPRDSLTTVSPLEQKDCDNFIKRLRDNQSGIRSGIVYTQRKNTSVPASLSKWMIDVDVNTGLPTTDMDKSRVNGRVEDCMKVCDKFSACKSIVIKKRSQDPESAESRRACLTSEGVLKARCQDRVCHLKTEQAEGMTTPSTTHSMLFKTRGGPQREITPEEIKAATWFNGYYGFVGRGVYTPPPRADEEEDFIAWEKRGQGPKNIKMWLSEKGDLIEFFEPVSNERMEWAESVVTKQMDNDFTAWEKRGQEGPKKVDTWISEKDVIIEGYGRHVSNERMEWVKSVVSKQMDNFFAAWEKRGQEPNLNLKQWFLEKDIIIRNYGRPVSDERMEWINNVLTNVLRKRAQEEKAAKEAAAKKAAEEAAKKAFYAELIKKATEAKEAEAKKAAEAAKKAAEAAAKKAAEAAAKKAKEVAAAKEAADEAWRASALKSLKEFEDAEAKVKVDAAAKAAEIERERQQQIHLDKMKRYEEAKAARHDASRGWGW